MTRIFFTPSHKNNKSLGFSFFRILFGFILLISLPGESLGAANVKAPTDFRAQAIYQTSITWTWTDNATNETGFRLYGAATSTGPFVLLADIGPNITSYTEINLTAGTSYFRYVAAVNAGGVVTSNGVSARTSDSPALSASFSTETVDTSGGFSSMAVDKDGNLHVAYSDFKTGKLKYLKRTGSVWQTPQVIDPGSGAISRVSLALEGLGNPHIAYSDLDGSKYRLKYARWSGAGWSTEIIESSAEDVGTYPSIAVDISGHPHISYYKGGPYYFDLRYARFNGSSWIISTVDSAGDVGAYTSIALDSFGRPHIAYQDFGYKYLKYAKWTGTGWSITTVDYGSVGWEASLALDGSDNPHIVYRKGVVGSSDLQYAKFNGTAWTLSTVDSAGDVGYYPSPVLDGAGNLHVSYMDATNLDLKYAFFNGSEWKISIADSGDVTYYSSAILDGSGNSHISYYANNADLKVAHWTGAAFPAPKPKDIYPPVSRVTAPLDNSFYTSLVTISGTAYDAHSPLAKVEVSVKDETTLKFWNGASWVATESWVQAQAQGENWSFVPPVESGHSYFAKSRAFDSSGNMESPYNPNGDTWATLAPMPTPRRFLAAGVINGKLYVAGGKKGTANNLSFQRTLEVYDSITDTWEEKAPMSIAPGELAGGVINGKLYTVGGGILQVYDPTTDTWETKTSMPTPRQYPAVGVINKKLYVVGGLRDHYALATLEVYDPATDTWETKTSMPTPRMGPTAGVIDGKFYIVGGLGNYVGDLSTLEVYDPVTDTWITKTSMPTPRWLSAAGVISGNLYVSGGAGNGSNIQSTFEVYDPTTDTWQKKTSMPTARYALACSVINGNLYAVGGDNIGDIATIEVYTPLEASGGVRYTYKVPSATVVSTQTVTELTSSTPTTTAVSTQTTSSATETVISTPSATLPMAPSELTATPSTGAIALSWAVSASTSVTAYHVYMATSASNLFSQPAAVLSSAATSWEAGGLTAGLLYQFAVRAKNGFGEEKNTNILEAAPLSPSHSACSAMIKVPHNGKKVSGESLTVIAEILCGDSSKIDSIRFEYKLASQENWLAIPASNQNHPNPDFTFPYFVHWNVGALASGEYHIRAVAKSKEGKEDLSSGFVTIFAEHSDPDVLENGTTKTEKIGNHKDNNVRAGFGNQVADVEIPAGSLASSETKLSLKFNPLSLPSASGLLSAKAVISVEFENGQHQLNKEASLAIPYEDADGDGIVDGLGIGEDSLSAYYYDEGKKSWKKLASSVDASKNIVTLKTNHFSLFGLFAQTPPPSAVEIPFALGEAYVFPNPSRGPQNPIFHIEVGQADEVEVFIYDVSGALVETLRTTGSPQTINSTLAYEIPWTPTASGIYVAVIHARKAGEADIRLSRKFGVIR